MVHSCYDNRELSWLKFNTRVLEEAEDLANPFCERLSFASIFQSNLDEFFMVRCGSLHDQMCENPDFRENKTNMTCKEQLTAIYARVRELLRDKDDESTLIPEVEVSEIEGYKAAGIIAGGMIPKIGGMADAIYQGVHEAVIIDGRVPHSILLELFSNRGSGTRFYRRSHQE